MAGHLKKPFRQLRIGQIVWLQDLPLFLFGTCSMGRDGQVALEEFALAISHEAKRGMAYVADVEELTGRGTFSPEVVLLGANKDHGCISAGGSAAILGSGSSSALVGQTGRQVQVV